MKLEIHIDGVYRNESDILTPYEELKNKVFYIENTNMILCIDSQGVAHYDYFNTVNPKVEEGQKEQEVSVLDWLQPRTVDEETMLKTLEIVTGNFRPKEENNDGK